MTTIHGIASIEVEERLMNALEDLKVEEINDLLVSFDFNEDFLKQASIDIAIKNTSVATLLLSKTSKNVKEEVLDYFKKNNSTVYQQLDERIEL